MLEGLTMLTIRLRNGQKRWSTQWARWWSVPKIQYAGAPDTFVWSWLLAIYPQAGNISTRPEWARLQIADWHLNDLPGLWPTWPPGTKPGLWPYFPLATCVTYLTNTTWQSTASKSHPIFLTDWRKKNIYESCLHTIYWWIVEDYTAPSSAIDQPSDHENIVQLNHPNSPSISQWSASDFSLLVLKMTGGAPEVRSDKSLTLLTFCIRHSTIDTFHLTFDIQPMDQWTNGRMVLWTNGPMDQWSNGPMDQ